MNAKKKILAVALAASMAVLAVGGSSLAYFTDTDEKENTFTVGNVGIVLTEPNWDEYGANDALDLYPGEPIAKDPQVTNDGANPAVIRVKVAWPTGPNAVEFTIRYKYAEGYNTADWTYNADDGYYYYNKVLNPGETTTPVFDQVVAALETTTNDSADDKIVVTAEAVQSQGIFAKYSDLVPGYNNPEPDYTIDDGAWEKVYDFFGNAFKS